MYWDALKTHSDSKKRLKTDEERGMAYEKIDKYPQLNRAKVNEPIYKGRVPSMKMARQLLMKMPHVDNWLSSTNDTKTSSEEPSQ